MNRHHLRLGAACLALPILVSTCGKLFEEPLRPTVSDRSAPTASVADTSGSWTAEPGGDVLGTDGSAFTDAGVPVVGSDPPPFGPGEGSSMPLATGGSLIATGGSTVGVGAPDLDPSNGGFSSAAPVELGDAPPPDDAGPVPPGTEPGTEPDDRPPATTPTTGADSLPRTPPAEPTPEPMAHGVAVMTDCGRLQVGLPDADGWRNATWTSGTDQEMNVLGLGWNPARSIGVRVGPSAFWIAVACASPPSLELAETYVITTCGTLRVANGTATGTREVSWQSDRVGDARMALAGGSWTPTTRQAITAGGHPFEVVVTCGPTQSVSVQ